MQYKGFKVLKIRIDKGVAFVTIDNPPINLMSMQMLMELNKFSRKVSKDDEVKVIVFDSADPEFFIAHFDVESLLQRPYEAPPKSDQLLDMNPVLETYRTMPKVSIALIEGICRGGGSEFILALDMIFAAIGKAVFAQPEISLGITPGGGSTQRLPRVMGKSRALEVVLTGADIPAEIAELYGYINRALPPDELRPFVEKMAYRIAQYPAETIALVKQAVITGLDTTLKEGLLEEQYIFGQSTALPSAKSRMRTFMELGGQTREVELNFSKLIDEFLVKFENKEL